MADKKTAVFGIYSNREAAERAADAIVKAGFSPQLTLEAAMLRQGGFKDIPAGASVAEIAGVSLVEIAGLSMSSIRSASPTGFAHGFLKLALEFGGHPARLAHRSAATRPGSQWAERGRASTASGRSRADPIEPRLLLVVERTVESRQRRLYRIQRLQHRIEPLFHGCQPTGRRQHGFGRTVCLQDIACLGGRFLQPLERCHLRIA